jgi:hypothetical protein
MLLCTTKTYSKLSSYISSRELLKLEAQVAILAALHNILHKLANLFKNRRTDLHNFHILPEIFNWLISLLMKAPEVK